MLPDVVEILSDMVRIDSRNTMPLEAEGERVATEEAMGCYVAEKLQSLGMSVEKQYIAPMRPNVIGYYDCGVAGAKTIGFNAHMDTVGTDGMKIPPFEPEIKDGCIYGRGSCDTKASLATMLKACETLIQEKAPINLLFVATASEETACQGAPLLKLDKWSCDGFIVGEPTSNRPVVYHKCQGCFDLVCRGKSAHASRTELGDNAIVKAAKLLCWLDEVYRPELEAITSPHFERGCTISPDMISGGVKANIVPDSCRITCDMRLVPEAGKAEDIFKDLVSRIEKEVGFAVEMTNTVIAPAMQTPLEHPFVKLVCGAVNAAGVDGTPSSVAYCTDGGVLSSKGYPCVVLGAGDIGVAHSAVEFCPIDQLYQVVGIYAEIGRGLAGI